MRHCKEGRHEAFEALSTEVEPETIRFLNGLSKEAEQLDPRFDLKQLSRQCRNALDRIHILEKPDWKKIIASLLSTTQGDWAEVIAARKAPELLRDHYRRLLEADRKRLEPLLRQSLGPEDSGSFEYRFVHALPLKEVSGDFTFNLHALADYGGELTPREKQRLYHFGLLGGAEQRLLELLR